MKLKKITALLLALLLVSALTACETKPGTPQDNHLDWVYVPETAEMGAVSENGYYYRHKEQRPEKQSAGKLVI